MNQTQTASTRAPHERPESVPTSETSHRATAFDANGKSELIDRMAVDTIARYLPGARTIDLGVGSPNCAERLAPYCTDTIVSIAATQWLDATDNPTIALPDECADVAYCLRTFPHLGRSPDRSRSMAAAFLAELIRVLSPGGLGFVHYYNPFSLLGMQAQIRRSANYVTEAFGGSEREGPFARWDTTSQLLAMLPDNAELVRVVGLNLMPADQHVLQLPLIGVASVAVNWRLRNNPIFSRWSGENLAIIRRIPDRPVPSLADLEPPTTHP